MDKNKLILIAGTVLIVIALILSAVSVIMTSSVLKKISTSGIEETLEAEEEVKKVPISETVPFELTSAMIGTLPSTDEPGKVANVSIEIGFRIEDKKKTEDLLELMTANEGIIRDRISKLIATKTLEEYDAPGFTDQFQKEILDLVSTELETELIVEVYFKNNLKSMK